MLLEWLRSTWIPLLRTEPDGYGSSIYKHVTPSRGETHQRLPKKRHE
jgi:hypothetical protein